LKVLWLFLLNINIFELSNEFVISFWMNEFTIKENTKLGHSNHRVDRKHASYAKIFKCKELLAQWDLKQVNSNGDQDIAKGTFAKEDFDDLGAFQIWDLGA